MTKMRSLRGSLMATCFALVLASVGAAPLEAEMVTLMGVYDPWPGDPKTTDTEGSALAVSPDGRHVYAVSRHSYAISIYERDTTSGALSFLADAPSSFDAPYCEVVDGVVACHSAFGWHQALGFSPDGRHLYACVEGANRIVLYDRDTATGLLTEGSNYPAGGFCSIALSADGTKLFVGDVGSVQILSREAIGGTLTSEQTVYTGLGFQLGIGASPDGTSLYVPSRDDVAVGVLRRDPDTGLFAVEQIVDEGLYVSGYAHAAPVNVVVSPDGAHVYVAVRVSDHVLPMAGSIAIYARAPATGRLTLSEVVRDDAAIDHALLEPRKLLLSGDGSRLVVQGWVEVSSFARDAATGGLTFRGRDDQTCSWTGSYTAAAISADATDIYVDSIAGAGKQGLVYWFRTQGPSSADPCSATPLTGCEQAYSSSLTIRNADGVGGDRLTWKWNGGGAEDFAARGDYMTCTYTDDGSGFVLIHQSFAPGICWIPSGHGWSLSSSSNGGLPQPRARMSKVKVKSTSTATGAKRIIRLLAKRADVLPPALPFAATATTLVQFVAGDGRCWEDSYSGDDVVENDAQQFKAKRRIR